jgi:predicted ATPase/serine/threonine protein kinase
MLKPGDIIGGTYRLVQMLGQGGWGAVWLAEHILLNENRALKVILSQWASDPNIRLRFIKGEARNTLRLERHPNLVRSYDLGLHGDVPYIVMEYIEGETLQSKLRHGRLSVDETADILEQIAAGLDVAHRQGLIHRDIKPANIFITNTGIVKVGDFGLTKDLETKTDITSVGFTVGTITYIAPEQASGNPETKSDIYGLGVMVFEMLAGRTPFSGAAPQLLMQHLTQPPPSLRQIVPDIPPEVEKVVNKALAKKPEERFATAGDFAKAFRAAAGGTPLVLQAEITTDPLLPSVQVPVTDDDQTRRLKVVPRPTGMVTFLFTDIEGSTRLWESDPEAMRIALARHDLLMRQTFDKYNGYIFKTVGDAFCVAFANAMDGLMAALETQRSLHVTDWTTSEPLRVRMALHTGMVEVANDDYLGPTVNRVARIMAAGHGGQILLSHATQMLIADFLPTDAELRDMGQRRLKDLARPEQLFQLCVPDLPGEFPALRTQDNRPHNLPAPPTSLVGRETEVTTLRNLLRQPNVRLVTLLGPGGTGKTRLSLQVARELLEEFEDGVYMVELATIADATLVAPAIAQALGLKDSGTRSYLDTLKAHMRDRQILLVLDNFEQVIDAAPLITQLLANASRAKVLVSSRSVLNVYGEYEFQVPPLAVPATDNNNLKAIEALRAPAVNLFVQRAKAVRPDFELTDKNAPVVAEICARLDGLPLAIELAAARCRNMKPEDIRRGLGQRLALLVSGFRDLPARQQTLRGAISWGYDLLDEAEKRLFARLAIFVGGFTTTAVTGVGLLQPALNLNAPATLDDTDFEVVDLLEALTDKSLLRMEEHGGEPRFNMLETLREFALERLGERDETELVRARHAAYYLLLAETAEPELDGTDQEIWYERIETEHANLRAALNWAFGAGPENPQRLETGLRITGALGWFWTVRGHFNEGRDWLMKAVGVAQKSDDRAIAKDVRAKVFMETGQMLRFLGNAADATPYLEQCITLRREIGDRETLAPALGTLGIALADLDDYERATALHEEALALRRQIGDKNGMGNSLNNLGMLALKRHELPKAQELFEQSLAIKREMDDTWGIATALDNLGTVFRLEGKREKAIEAYRESITLFSRLGEKQFLIECVEGLASLANPEEGVLLLAAAHQARQDLSIPLPVANRADYDNTISMMQVSLSPADFWVVWEKGRNINLTQALEIALVVD